METLWKLLYLLEPAPMKLIATAVGVTFGSAFRALNYGKEMGRNHDLSEASITLDRSQALMIPVMSSCSLLLMFYLFSCIHSNCLCIIHFLLFVSLCCLSKGTLWSSRPFCISLLFEVIYANSRIIIVGMHNCCCSLVSFWALGTEHFVRNFYLYCICLSCSLPNVKICTMLLACLFVYDIFWVFFSERFFGANVMVSVATQQAHIPVHTVANSLSLPGLQLITKKLELPVKIVFPRNLLGGAVRGGSSADFLMLGLGDMAIPAMLLALVLCFDYRKSRDSVNLYDLYTSKGHKYIWYALPGYAIGLVTALAAGVLTHSPQPALLYLVPSTLGPVIVISWFKRDLAELWEGNMTNLVEKSREIGV